MTGLWVLCFQIATFVSLFVEGVVGDGVIIHPLPPLSLPKGDILPVSAACYPISISDFLQILPGLRMFWSIWHLGFSFYIPVVIHSNPFQLSLAPLLLKHYLYYFWSMGTYPDWILSSEHTMGLFLKWEIGQLALSLNCLFFHSGIAFTWS